MSRVSAVVEADNALVGTLRCLLEKRHRARLTTYKKRFWVVNLQRGCLEFYKNDQQHVPQGIISAADIRGVLYGGEKQNKFYVLIIELRKKNIVKFRMDSLESRDRWSTAITSLVEKHSFNNRLHSIVSVISRRAKSLSASLGVSITVNLVYLSAIPDRFLQYVVEAVDVVLTTITVIVRSYGEEGEFPREYVVHVFASDGPNVRDIIEPKYDPTTKTLVLSVNVCGDVVGHVQFQAVDASEVGKLLQSEVWRNPLIEGWITADPVCKAVCTDIAKLLLLKRPFGVTFQWGPDVRDTRLVEEYLMRHVHGDLLRKVLNAIKDVAFEGAGSTIAGTAAQRMSTEQVAKRTRMLAESVTGVSIRIDALRVSHDLPPSLHLVYSASYHKRYSSSLMVVLKYKKEFEELMPEQDTLRAQLENVVLHSHLAKKLVSSRHSLKENLGCTGYVTVNWEQLFHAYKALNVRLTPSELPNVVSNLTDFYGSRIHTMKQIIRGPRPMLDNGEAVLYSTFLKCINSVIIGFSVLRSDGAERDIPEPTVVNGVLTDPIVCCTDASKTDILAKLKSHQKSAFTSTTTLGNSSEKTPLSASIKPATLPSGLFLYPAEFRLGSWAERYFSHPENCKRSYGGVVELDDILDDFDTTSSSGTLGFDFEFGEMVANERSAETQVLDRHRVVNNLYDSQGSNVHLKIGSEGIRSAIRALENAFPHRRISKHYIRRVLGTNLRLLRRLYSDAAEGDAFALLSRGLAAKVLRNYCEYEMNEKGIPEYIEAHLSKQRSSPRSTFMRVERESRPTENEVQSITVNDEPSADPSDPAAASEVAPVEHVEQLPKSKAEAGREGESTPPAKAYEGHPPYYENVTPSQSGTPEREPPFNQDYDAAAAATATDAAAATPRGGGGSGAAIQPPATTGNDNNNNNNNNNNSTSTKLAGYNGSPRRSELDRAAANVFNFEDVAMIALTNLLPLEAKTSRLGWRIGLVAGLQNTGKTLITNCLHGIAMPTAPTVGLAQQVVSFSEWVFSMNELGGRDCFRKNWEYYMVQLEKVDFVMYVIDSLNRRAYDEASRYLQELAKEFKNVPFLIVMNNYRKGARGMPTLQELSQVLRIEKLRRHRGADCPVVAVPCDISVVHSANKVIPDKLRNGLEEICTFLRTHSPEGQLPVIPKNVGPEKVNVRHN